MHEIENNMRSTLLYSSDFLSFLFLIFDLKSDYSAFCEAVHPFAIKNLKKQDVKSEVEEEANYFSSI